jgi:hypothetical protein
MLGQDLVDLPLLSTPKGVTGYVVPMIPSQTRDRLLMILASNTLLWPPLSTPTRHPIHPGLTRQCLTM